MGTAAQRYPTRGLTEGAILAALTALVAAIGLFIPPVAILLAPIPIMLLVIRWGMRIGLLAAVVAGLITMQFFGPLNAFSAVILFGPLGLALGWGARRGARASWTILAGATALCGSFIASLAIGNFVLHQDILGHLSTAMAKSAQMADALERRLGLPQELVGKMTETNQAMSQLLPVIAPMLFIMTAVIWAYFSYLSARAVLRRLGHELPAPPPMLAWRISLPVASVLLYAVAGFSLASLWVAGLTGAALNAMLLALYAFGFQGVLVGIAFMNRRQIPRIMQLIAGLLVFQLSFQSNLAIPALAIIGILDSWFDYRRLTHHAAPATPALSVTAPADSAAQDPRPRPRKRKKERKEQVVKVVRPS